MPRLPRLPRLPHHERLARTLGRRRPGKRTILALVAVIAAIANLPSTPAPLAGPVTMDQVDAWFDAELRDTGIPGAALVVVQDGRIVHERGFGTADDSGRPVTAETPFFIGSLSKSYTALAVAQLAEAGRIDLDAPVRRYLPQFDLADPAAADAVTVRQLLNQTSGIPTSAGTAPLRSAPTSLDAQVRALASVAPTAAPGVAYQYSNANYVVLGHLVEVVSGQGYGDYLQAHVFGPLDMRHATTDLAVAQSDGLTRAHRLWFGLADSHMPLYREDLAPAGFIAASADDLGHGLVAMIAGGRYGSTTIAQPATIAELERGVAPTGMGDARYAMGWLDTTFEGEHVLAHDGSTTDMAAFQAMVPSRGIGVAILFNGQSALYELLQKPDAIGQGVLSMLLGRQPRGTLERLYPVFDLAVAAAFAFIGRGILREARRPLEPAGVTGRTGRPCWRRVSGVAWRVYLDGIVPAVILLRVPVLLGADWPVLVRLDIGLVLFVLAGLRIVDGAVRLGRLARERHLAAAGQAVPTLAEG